MSFKEKLKEIKKVLELINKKGMDLQKKTEIFDFKKSKIEYYKRELKTNVSSLSLKNIESDNIDELKKLIHSLENNLTNTKTALEIIDKLMQFKIKEKENKINITNIPYELKEDIKADLEEIQKCYEHSCYRSAVIMCGRVLEIALHRKYYEATKKDILETNPNIGLGKLIAKLKDENIEIDPALKQQIHLINQIRVNSVHVKKKLFQPSKDQTQAIILYTQDIISKIFTPQHL